jgi:hypothetical protein
MPPYETTYKPIDGLEAKKALRILFDEAVDKIPLLRQGNAFDRIKLQYGVVVTAFPSDVPVPEMEFTKIIETTESAEGQFSLRYKKIEELNERRKSLVSLIERIDKVLDVIAPETEIVDEVSAGDTPDELRERLGLPLTVLAKNKQGHRAEIEISSRTLIRR